REIVQRLGALPAGLAAIESDPSLLTKEALGLSLRRELAMLDDGKTVELVHRGSMASDANGAGLASQGPEPAGKTGQHCRLVAHLRRAVHRIAEELRQTARKSDRHEGLALDDAGISIGG